MSTTATTKDIKRRKANAPIKINDVVLSGSCIKTSAPLIRGVDACKESAGS